LIGTGQDFDGTNDNILLPSGISTGLNGAGSITVEMCLKRDATGVHSLFGLSCAANKGKVNFDIITGNYLRIGGRSQEADGFQQKTTDAALTDTANYKHLAGVLSVVNDSGIIYINGESQAVTGTVSFTPASFNSDTGTYHRIGASVNDTPINFANGKIDEVRLSKSIRAAEWIKATYYSNFDNIATYYKYTTTTTTTSTTTSSSSSSSTSTMSSSSTSSTNTQSSTTSSTSTSNTQSSTSSTMSSTSTTNSTTSSTMSSTSTTNSTTSSSTTSSSTTTTVPPIIKNFEAPYSLAVIAANFKASYSLQGFISKSFQVIYNLAIILNKSFEAVYELLDANKITKNIKSIYSIIDIATINYKHAVRVICNGMNLNIQNIQISCDEASYCFALSMTLSDINSWNICTAGKSVTIIVNEDVFGFIIDSRGRQRTFGNTIFSVSGRSKTKQLDYPDALPVSTEYGSTTARTVALALCMASGLSLSWDIIDWTIPANTLIASAESPLNIIKRLAEAAGAVLQSSKAGDTLIVRYSYPVSPTCYNDNTVDLTLTDTMDITDINEQFEKRPGYNKVRVSNKQIVDAADAYIYIELDPVRNSDKTTFLTTDPVFLRIYSNIDYNVICTAGTITKIKSGEVLAMDEEIVSFIHDEDPELSRPIESITSITWMGNNLGTLSEITSTKIRASLAGASSLGIGKVNYKAQYDVWKLTPPVIITDQFNIYVLSAQEITT
jgi:hypothetical protein